MNLENILEDDLLLICPNSVKTSVLKYLAKNKKLMKIKFMSLQEFKKKYLFDYDIEAIKYLVDKHHEDKHHEDKHHEDKHHEDKHQMKVANAKDILENLYYVDENISYDSEKLNQLVVYKKELKNIIKNKDNKEYLIYDNLFKKSLSNYNKIKVYGYGKLDKFDEKLIKKEVNGEVIDFEQKEDKSYKIYKFDNIEEEVEYLFDEIVRLIQEGVDINNILVANLDKEYFPYIKRYEKYYGIEFQLPEKNSIIGTELVKDFLKKLDDGFSNGVQYWFDKKTYYYEVASELLTIVRKYCSDKNFEEIKDLSEIKDQIIADVNSNEIIQKKLSNEKSKEKIDDFLLHIDQGFKDGLQAWFDKEAIKEDSYISVLNSLLSVVNKYAKYINDLSKVKELIKDDLQHTYIKQPKKTNVVQVVNVLDPIEDDQYLFLVGFNDNIPMTYKDTEYITDNIRNEVGRSTTEKLNENSKDNTLAWLSSISNLNISYKNKSPFNKYNVSSLIDELIIGDKEPNEKAIRYNNENNYSLALQRRKYGALLDKYRKYGDPNVGKQAKKYYKELKEANYQKYDNQFNAKLGTVVKLPLSLSYSSLSTYCECPFKYYLTRVLDVTDYEENLATSLGNVIHKVLEYADQEISNEELKKLYRKCVNDPKCFEVKNIDSRVQMFIDVIENNLFRAIDFVKEQKKNNFNGEMEEIHEMKVDLKNVAKDTDFTGKLDKIMYNKKGSTVNVAIVDYKTGEVKSKINEVKYGFSLQLPIYLYMLKKGVEQKKIKEFFDKEVNTFGFYIQRVLNPKPTFDEDSCGKDLKLSEQQWDELKLNGYSLNDADLLIEFDINLDKYSFVGTVGKYRSNYIKSIALKKEDKENKKNPKNVLSSRSIISEEERGKLIDDTEELIQNKSREIIEGNFEIKPIKLNGTDKSCAYCKFANICYKKEKDYLVIGREEDAESEEEKNAMD